MWTNWAVLFKSDITKIFAQLYKKGWLKISVTKIDPVPKFLVSSPWLKLSMFKMANGKKD